MSLASLLRGKVIDPLWSLLRHGVSPDQLAWSVALGSIIGVIPVLGVTTLLCTVVALPLRLNLVAIQAVNWLVYPLQFLLILPFFRLGERLFGAPPLTLAPSELLAMIKADTWGSVQALWSTTMHGLVVWLIAGIPMAMLIKFFLARLFRVTLHRMAIHPLRPEGAAS